MALPAAGFLPFLGYFFGTTLKAFVFRTLALLGIGVITYTGSTVALDELSSFVTNQFSSIPPQVSQALGILRIDVFMSIIISAYSIKVSIQTARGAYKKLGLR